MKGKVARLLITGPASRGFVSGCSIVTLALEAGQGRVGIPLSTTYRCRRTGLHPGRRRRREWRLGVILEGTRCRVAPGRMIGDAGLGKSCLVQPTMELALGENSPERRAWV